MTSVYETIREKTYSWGFYQVRLKQADAAIETSKRLTIVDNKTIVLNNNKKITKSLLKPHTGICLCYTTSM